MVTRVVCASLVCVVLGAASASAQPHDDILIGRSAAQALRVGGLLSSTDFVVLPPGPLGWADNDPGFDAVSVADTAADLYPLQSGAEIYLELVSTEPAFRAISPAFEVLDQPGERAYLGDSALHTHLTWNIWSADPQFDPQKVVWHPVFRLVDLGTTAYASSQTFSIRFATRLAGDLDQDGDVDESDLGILLGAWQSGSAGDVDLDGDTDEADLGALLANWGVTT